LGDFYRQDLKDDDRALSAYRNVLARTTWAPWGRPRKPAATGASKTLAAATQAVSDILRKRGEHDEIAQLRFNLLLAQAEAAASVLRTDEMTARLEEAIGLPGRSAADMKGAAKRILALEDDVRKEIVRAAGALATGLSDDMRSLLLEKATGPETKQSEIAVRALLMFAPIDRIGGLLDKTTKE
jgi:hypothetical protein